MAVGDEDEQVHAETLEEWRAWLADHHADRTGVWLVSWRSGTGRPTVDYLEAVTEALTVGWIDSVTRTLDAERRAQRFSPRKPGSGWAATNKARVERLLAEGRMQPSGQAVIDAAHADGSWTLYDDVEALVVPDDLAARLDAAGLRPAWDAWPPSARKQALGWLVTAKRAETRAGRVERLLGHLADGTRL
jgi:uncharacterized protein YdeI (YjbR/CyaY-like superfamily)